MLTKHHYFPLSDSIVATYSVNLYKTIINSSFLGSLDSFITKFPPYDDNYIIRFPGVPRSSAPLGQGKVMLLGHHISTSLIQAFG